MISFSRTPRFLPAALGRLALVLGAFLPGLLPALRPDALSAQAVAPAAASLQADLILRNGRVLDGAGNPWVRADVAVRGDRIVAVGRLDGWSAAEELDVEGLYVAPGFIDVHTHAAEGLTQPDRSHAFPHLAQGITTVFLNPDGGGAVDLEAQRTELLADGLGVNAALLVPHGSVRSEVMGMADRAPTPGELDRMRGLVRAGMEAGAFGLSSGPFYAPGSYADTDELVELAKVAAEFGGVYTSHIRDESDYTIGLVAAVDEVITVARESGARSIVTHIKALGPRVWGYSTAVVRRIERAREEGLEVFADQYAYTASATGLSAALVPRWAQEGGTARMRERFQDPEDRGRIVEEMLENLDRRGGADRIQFRSYGPDPSIEGRTLEDVARERGKDPVETSLDLLAAGLPGIVSFNMDDRDLAEFMRQPWTMASSDGEFAVWEQGVPHPRANGAFARRIRVYVMEEGVLTLEDAVRGMTSLPASVHHMHDRGLIRAGSIADIAVFDLERVRDLATFTEPHQYAEGMVHVLVNGALALRDGEFTDVRSGRVLRMERP
jgi:N-acyl-D-amino-acid deacylase